MPLSLSFTLISKTHHSDLSRSLSQLRSLIVKVTATEARRHWLTSRPKLPISFRPTPPSASNPRRWSECLLVEIGYLTGKPMVFADPPLLPTQLADVVLVCDWWFFILFGWFGLRKKIEDLSFFFFFFFFLLWTGGGGGGGCGCGYGNGWW